MCVEDCPVRLEKRTDPEENEYWVLLDEWEQVLWSNNDNLDF